MSVAAGEDARCDMCAGPLKAPMAEAIAAGFPCHACGEVLHSSLRLSAHSVKHTGIRPFFCTRCPRNFTRRERLFDHIGAFHPEAQQTDGAQHEEDPAAESDEADERDEEE